MHRKFLLAGLLLAAAVSCGCPRQESVSAPPGVSPPATARPPASGQPATAPATRPPVSATAPATSPATIPATPPTAPPATPAATTPASASPRPTAQSSAAPIAPLGYNQTAENGDAARALERALDFYASIITERTYPGFGACGGWASGYSGNLKRRKGEYRPIGEECVCVQYPGTPGTGRSFLQGYLTLGLARHLEAARKAGNLLLAGATEAGGFNYELWLGPDGAHGVHNPGTNSPPRDLPRSATLDDGVTQGAAEFLYALWLVTRDDRYLAGYRRGLDFYLAAQMPNGGMPQAYPSGGYHAYATFNDRVALSVFQDLIQGYRRTAEERYLQAALRLARWVAGAQAASGSWGYQYNAEGQPAGARAFEPPAVGPASVADAVVILTEAFRWTQDETFLQPIPGGLAWLERSQLAPGRWARFYHPDSNRPWYRTEGGSDLDTIQGAKGGYAWEGDWGLEAQAAWQAFQANRASWTRPQVPPGGSPDDPALMIMPQGNAGGKYRESIADIIASQDGRGAFVERDGISGRIFCAYVHQLVRYLRGGRGRERPESP